MSAPLSSAFAFQIWQIQQRLARYVSQPAPKPREVAPPPVRQQLGGRVRPTHGDHGGTLYGYHVKKCRCARCKRAKAMQWAEYRAKRLEMRQAMRVAQMTVRLGAH